MREREVKAYLLTRVKELGGEARKVRWEGRNKAPDWLVMLPPATRRIPVFRDEDDEGWMEWQFVPLHFFAELKATGERPDALQLEEHATLRALGQTVVVLDSKESIDACLIGMRGMGSRSHERP